MVATRYSICATHYNNIEYIEESVGVLAEKIRGRPEWEMVIVDAGSDDGSLEYMQNLEDKQSNIRIVIEEGVSIGHGRELAVQKAAGDILIQIMDLDAEYHDDDRLFEITEFYESVLEQEGPVQLSAGAYFSTKELMNELGGWKDLVANEETELKRRALRAGKLRFCPVFLYKEHTDDKGLVGSIKRFYHNTCAKFQEGVGFWHMFFYWVRHSTGLRSRLGAVLVFPVAWVNSRGDQESNHESYTKHDPYIKDFQKVVYERRPKLWLEPPEKLQDYVIPHRWNHITN